MASVPRAWPEEAEAQRRAMVAHVEQARRLVERAKTAMLDSNRSGATRNIAEALTQAYDASTALTIAEQANIGQRWPTNVLKARRTVAAYMEAVQGMLQEARPLAQEMNKDGAVTALAEAESDLAFIQSLLMRCAAPRRSDQC